ncbi:Mitochondrial ornithine transporter 1 [Lamellibrachia satsuma]|nr:Mitochondrial ornithine transporter 1 [Lamellibrachia satsuma]
MVCGGLGELETMVCGGLGAVKTMVCGGLGGVALWLAVFPTDVIKSRVQVQVNHNKPQLSFIPMLLAIIREEGVRALYKGLGPTILRTFPATGGLFLAYETTKRVLLGP